MGRVKTSVIILSLIAAALILSGCTSSSSGNNARVPMVVATVGAPTPIPTEPPEPTPGPTWVPTPTPRPPPVTLSDLNLTVKINGDQKPISDDPDQGLPVNAQYATRQDTVKFSVKNTGDATLNGLDIIYQLVTPMSIVDSYNGQTSTTYRSQSTTFTIGTLKPGETRGVTMEAPAYGAMLESNVTISAKWDGGSLDIYRATLEPDFRSGSYVNPTNDLQVKMYGSAYN